MEKMSFEEFVSVVQALVSANPKMKGFKAEKKVVTKNNGQVMTGVMIQNLGDTGDVKAAPVIYLDGMYSCYVNGEQDVRTVVNNVIEIFYNAINTVDIDAAKNELEKISDEGYLLSHVLPMLVGTKANEAMLKEMPHREILDMSVIYYLDVSKEGEEEKKTAKITNCAAGKITEQELFCAAMNNAERIRPANVMDMNSLISSISKMFGFDMEAPAIDFPMYVITNEQRFLGAVSFMLDGVLKNLAEKLDDDLIIMPSSINEVIVVPNRTMVVNENLLCMTKEVNDSGVVAPDEVLSDSLYFYDRKSGRIEFLETALKDNTQEETKTARITPAEALKRKWKVGDVLEVPFGENEIIKFSVQHVEGKKVYFVSKYALFSTDTGLPVPQLEVPIEVNFLGDIEKNIPKEWWEVMSMLKHKVNFSNGACLEVGGKISMLSEGNLFRNSKSCTGADDIFFEGMENPENRKVVARRDGVEIIFAPENYAFMPLSVWNAKRAIVPMFAIETE